MEIILRFGVTVPLAEELVAGGPEPLPQLFRLLARNGAYLLPLLLEFDESVGRLLPVGAGLERLGLLDDRHLLFQIIVHGVLEIGIELPLAGKEPVACSTETVVDLLVLLLGGEPDSAPFLLDLLDLPGEVVPFTGTLDLLVGNGFHLLAEGSLGLKVLSIP